MSTIEIKGYTLDATPLRIGLCESYAATKDGKKFFFKIYTYEQDDPVTAKKHHEVQEEIKALLDDIGNISEEIVEHGVLAGHIDKVGIKPDAYYQVKPWCTGEDGKGCLDFQDYVNNTTSEIGEKVGSDPTRVAELVGHLAKLCFQISGLVKQCHNRKLVHQDLKPEQILMVPFAAEGGTGFRPVIADFDWSFVEGKTPLKNVGTFEYHSPEHIDDEPRTCASDVFTLAIIVFKVLGFNVHPLTTDEERDDFLTPEQSMELFKRCEVKQSLLAIYRARFPGYELNEAGLQKLDDVLAGCVARDAAKRPTAADVWSTLSDVSLMGAASDGTKGGPAPASAPTGAQDWFRLRVEDDESAFWTIRHGAGGTPDQLGLDRETAKRVFHDLADADGNRFYKFFKHGIPTLKFACDGENWTVMVPEEANNTFVLRSGDEEIMLDATPHPLAMGDTLTLYSRKFEREQTGCQLIVSPK